jgi:tetratricopeptide (TPR) repeat protein
LVKLKVGLLPNQSKDLLVGPHLRRLSGFTKPIFIVLAGVIVTACVGGPGRMDLPPADVEERVLVDGQALPYPEESRIRTESLQGTPSMSDAVKNLLDDAVGFKQINDYDAASEALERALRIEARNPAVWYELADLRLVHAEYEQAIQFAQKSNALTSGDDVTLKRRNWNLISVAYSALGNVQKAAEYRAKLRD